jgi:hypothetical protein
MQTLWHKIATPESRFQTHFQPLCTCCIVIIQILYCHTFLLSGKPAGEATFVPSHAPPAYGWGSRKTTVMAENETTPKAEAQLNNTQKKDWAKHLFLTEPDMTQKDIARRVGTSEQTMTKWVNEGKWDAMRRTLLVTNEEILRDLYTVLAGMKDEAKIAATDGDPNTQPNTDGIYKMALAIRKLENQTGVGAIIASLKQFITFIQPENFELSKEVTKWADLFIKSKLKGF